MGSNSSPGRAHPSLLSSMSLTSTLIDSPRSSPPTDPATHAADRISEYLTLGHHHNTPIARSVIVGIVEEAMQRGREQVREAEAAAAICARDGFWDGLARAEAEHGC